MTEKQRLLNRVGSQFKVMRKRRGLGVRDLAERAGYIGSSGMMPSKVENGKCDSVRVLKKLADALDCRLEIRFIEKK